MKFCTSDQFSSVGLSDPVSHVMQFCKTLKPESPKQYLEKFVILVQLAKKRTDLNSSQVNKQVSKNKPRVLKT